MGGLACSQCQDAIQALHLPQSTDAMAALYVIPKCIKHMQVCLSALAVAQRHMTCKAIYEPTSIGLHQSVQKTLLCRTLLLSSDQRMNFRGAAELLSGDDKAMQANNLAGINEYAVNPWLLIPSQHCHALNAMPGLRVVTTPALQS